MWGRGDSQACPSLCACPPAVLCPWVQPPQEPGPQTADRGRSSPSPAVGSRQELQAGQVPADSGVVQRQGPLQRLQRGCVALSEQPLHQHRVGEAGGQV